MRILGTTLGHPDHVRAQLSSLSATHDQLIEKVPTLPGAWMVLLYCCAARANYTLQVVHPELTAGFLQPTVQLLGGGGPQRCALGLGQVASVFSTPKRHI